jgi:proline dehydrogenase
MIPTGEKEFVHALKSIARNQEIKAYIEQSKDLYPLLLRASKRFVTGETRKEGVVKAKELLSKGYLVSLEYIGENTATEEECSKARNEFIELMKEVDSNGFQSTISFDLSHIGLCIHPDIAYHHLDEMAEEAEQKGLYLMISMEESAKTDQILDIYKRIVTSRSNVGVTLQVHLKRSIEDLNELLNYQGKIRIVKGAYQEPAEMAYARSEELDKRYLQFVETCVKANHPISIATHDEKLINQISKLGYLNNPHVEVEMLYGIKPDLIKQLKDDGYKTRVYLTYGKEWYLYLCHRIAEYPPNIYLAVADMIDPSRTENNTY